MPYIPSGTPAYRSGPSGTSAAMRAEFVLIQTELDKLSKYTGNGSMFIRVNSTGLAYEAVSVATAANALLPNSAALAAALGDETGTGVAVFNTSPTLVTPLLGTPTSGNLANCTFPTLNQNTTGNAATVTTNANLTGHVTSIGNAAVLGSFTSAQLATALTDETGTGANVFATSPTLVTPALGTPSALVGTNITGTAAGLSIGGNATTATNVTGTAVVTGAISSSSPTAGIGYAAGAGGSVTQITDITTTVALNNICGRITTVINTWSTTTTNSFLFNNSTIAMTDTITTNIIANGGTQGLTVSAEITSTGQAKIFIHMKPGGSGTGVATINFTVNKSTIN